MMWIRLIGVGVISALVSGCVSTRPVADVGRSGSNRFAIPAGSYTDAFSATREVLLGLGLTLDRIDARAGVLTTKPNESGGLATPWDRVQSDLRGEIADAAHPQRRVVRVRFVPRSEVDVLPGDAPGLQIAGGPLPESLVARSEREDLVGLVRVTIEREYEPYWRPSAVDSGRSSHARDPSLRSRGMSRSFAVPVVRDAKLEQRIASEVGRALDRLPG